MRVSLRNQLICLLIIIVIILPLSVNMNKTNPIKKNSIKVISVNDFTLETHKHHILTGKELDKIELKFNKDFPEKFAINELSVWWNSSWEYRVNITVSEPGIMARINWPLDVYLEFIPRAHKYSIRVLRYSGGTWNEVPYQLWNVTYENSTHIRSATITFPVTINVGETRIYQVYWSAKYKDPPSYRKNLLLEEESIPTYGTKYLIKSTGDIGVSYTVEIVPNAYSEGGTAINITLPSGNVLGDTLAERIVHFAVAENPTINYNDYLGDANILNPDYTVEIEEKRDFLTETFMGVMFITVKVINAKLRTSIGEDIGTVNITYRFYPWGILVSEKIKWTQQRVADCYYVAGWVFDQDDGVQLSMFDTIYTSAYAEPKQYGGSLLVFQDDVESGVNGWAPTGVWERGVPSSGAGELPAHSGSYVWGTNIGGNYPDYAYCTLTSSPIELPAGAKINLTFWHWWIIERWFDGGWVEINTTADGGWTQIVPIDGPEYTFALYAPHRRAWTGTHDSWVKSVFNLTEYAGKAVRIRFVFRSDGSVNYLGWYIDDIMIVCNEPEIERVDITDSVDATEVAFYHSSADNGIGMTILDEESSDITSTNYITWHNEGDEQPDDYIYWARNLSSFSTEISGGQYFIQYGIIPWLPTGSTPSERLSGFNKIVTQLHNPLSYEVEKIERYLISLNVTILDAENAPIESVNVSIYQGSNLVASELTNTKGFVIFDLERLQYQIKTTLKCANITYQKSVTIDLSQYDYTVFENTTKITYNLYHVKIQALAEISGTRVRLQDAKFLFNNSTFALKGYTDVEGWIDIYIGGGTWMLRFNATRTDTQKPDPYDNITLYSDPDFTNNITSFGRNLTIDINSNVIWYLRDWDMEKTTKKIYSTYLDVYTVPYPIDVYWNESFNVSVKIRLENGSAIDGTVYWYIFSGSTVMKQGSGDTTNGWYNFTVNTYDLNTGSYMLYINATIPSGTGDIVYQRPSPVEKAVTIKKRITRLSYEFSPSSSIYWNESLTITIWYTDYSTSKHINGATVKVTLLCGDIRLVYTLPEQGDKYVLEIANFDSPAGAYTVTIYASKDNYEEQESVTLLIVNERPTSLSYDSYVEYPWQESYVLAVVYIDSRYSVKICDANVTYKMLNPMDEIILQGNLTWNGTHYVATLNLTGVTEDIYRIYIYASKENFEQAEGIITFYLRKRRTIFTSEYSKITVIYGQNITIRFYFKDIDNEPETPIINANTLVMISVPGENKTVYFGELKDLGNGTYLLNMNSTKLGGLDIFNASISIYKSHYESKHISILIEVNPIPTKVLASKTSETTEWGLNITVYFEFNRTYPHNVRISDANVTFEIKDSEGNIILHGTLIESARGVYYLSINSSTIVSTENDFGTYVIYVYLKKEFYETQTVIIIWTITPISTLVSANPTNITVYWSDKAHVVLLYNRTRDLSFISNALIIYNLSCATLEKREDKYVLHINSSSLAEGIYFMNVTFKKEFHETKSIILLLTIKPIPTILKWSKIKSLSVEWGLPLELNFTLVMWNETLITNADAVCIIENGNVFTFSLIEIEPGVYQLYVNTSQIASVPSDLGTYTVEIIFRKTHFEAQKITFALTINAISTIVPTPIPQNVTLYWGESEDVIIEWRRKRDYAPIHNAFTSLTILVGGQAIEIPQGAFIIEERENDYVLHVNASLLPEDTLYEVIIDFSKEFHVNKSCSIYVTVKSIPLNVIMSTQNPSITWGTDLNISLVINDARTGKGVEDVTINLITTPEMPNNSILLLDLGNGNYILAIKGGILEADQDYVIDVIIEKAHYTPITKRIALHVSKVCVKMEIEMTQYIEKSISPLDYGNAITTLKLRILERDTGIPLNVTKFLKIYIIGEDFEKEISDVTEIVPGFYEAKISWRDIPPGEYYLKIEISQFTRNNYIGNWSEIIEVEAWLNGQKITPTVEQHINFRVSVDFMMGSEKIFGIYIPRLYFWLANGIGIFAVAYGIFKLVAWLRLPWEVKELIKIIKNVRKGVLEYRVPSRSDIIAEFLLKQLRMK